MSLKQVRARLERHVEPGFAPGMVGLVASGPEVETFVLGKMAFDGPDMRRDTIFRIASMTKPVTATAVMMLVEEGKLRLGEPVDDYLAFARMLLADGRHRGQPLLTPASAKAMKTNHLTASQRAGGEMILGRGRSWGYGMSVVTVNARPQFRDAGLRGPSSGFVLSYGGALRASPR